MDFFARQDAARRKTSVLLFYYLLAVVSIIGGIYLALMGILLYNGLTATQWNPDLLLSISILVLIIIGGGTLYKVSILKKGGSRVAEMLGGSLMQSNSRDLQERRLLNVVEEMAIASGVPVPPVYVLNDEKGINAFAAGFSPDTAVIGVTRGALAALSRDELQGVIGHEYSHILNGDMRLNIKLMGFLHGILVIAVIGRGILDGMSRGRRSSSGSKKNSGGGAIMLFALALVLIGYLGVFFGNLIKGAVSRQREYLADAAAVQFTRNPLGLAEALKKIGGLQSGSSLQSPRAEEASHMFFANGLKKSFLNLLATHPPLEERIRILDPRFDGKFPALTLAEAEKRVQSELLAADQAQLSSLAGADAPETATVADLSANPDKVIAAIGTPLYQHIEMAGRLLAGLPEKVRKTARDPFGARALIYCLLLDRNAGLRKIQLDLLATQADQAVYNELMDLLPLLEKESPSVRLPLVDLALPALRQLSPAQHLLFRKNVDALIMADRKINIFEYVLQYILVRHLEPEKGPAPSGETISQITQATAEISTVLSLLATVGHRGAREAGRAFDHAVRFFAAQYQTKFAFLPDGQVKLKDLDNALARLARARPDIRKSVMTACLACLAHDRKVTVLEAELFRAVGAALNSPMPLIMDEQEMQADRGASRINPVYVSS